jgi:DNA-binding LytR/AlgR family response regulator
MPLKILIIDDEPFAREDLHYMLAKHPDIEVIWEAGKIDEARQILAGNRPDIVFLDVQLRGGSGFDLLPDIQSISANIVFVSAHGIYAKDAIESGAVDFLYKPVTAGRLADSLAKARRCCREAR